MSMNHDQPPAYQSVPLDPIAPPYNPPGGSPAAGFTYPQQGAYSELSQSDVKNPQSQPGTQHPTQNITMHTVPQPNVVLVQPAVMVPNMLPSNPARVTCHSCHEMITTRVDREPNMQTHMIALICCVFGLWPCCLFPYCIDSCLSSKHYCPKCNAFIGQGVNQGA